MSPLLGTLFGMGNGVRVTPAEFQILEILWDGRRDMAVSEVLALLESKKTVAYTTVMTLLDKMTRKGSVRREKRGRAYYYRSGVQKPEVLQTLVDSFVQDYFNGRQDRLRNFLRNGVERKPAPRPARDTDLDISLL